MLSGKPNIIFIQVNKSVSHKNRAASTVSPTWWNSTNLQLILTQALLSSKYAKMVMKSSICWNIDLLYWNRCWFLVALLLSYTPPTFKWGMNYACCGGIARENGNHRKVQQVKDPLPREYRLWHQRKFAFPGARSHFREARSRGWIQASGWGVLLCRDPRREGEQSLI